MSMEKSNLAGLNILLGVSGGVAAYKAVELASKLGATGAKVHTIMTENACKLVTVKSFEAVTGRLDENCATHRTHCQALVCDRIDTVRDDLKGMDQSRERARNARIFAWDEFKKEIVPRNDFNEYKDEMKGHVTAIEVKMDRQSELLARLDERIKIFIKSNGN